jgi:hypothetical protein
VKWKFQKPALKGATVLESGGVQWLETGYLFNTNSVEEGGVAHLIDHDGRVLWSFPNPARAPDGKPYFYQDIKQVDLTAFLKANRL